MPEHPFLNDYDFLPLLYLHLSNFWELHSQQIYKLNDLKGYQAFFLCELLLVYFLQKCAVLQWDKMD